MQIQSLPATTGTTWVRDGWRFLRRQPIGLTAMVVLYIFLVMVPLSVPYVGVILYGIVYPYANVGLLAAFREVAAGKLPTPAVLGEALRDDGARRSLFKLALAHIVMVVVVAFVAFALFGQAESPDPAAPRPEELPVARVFALLLVYLPVAIAMFFAPVLVGWHGFGVGKALFGSAVAFWRNKGAILLWGFLVAATMLVATVLVNTLLATVVPPDLAPWLEAPVALVLATFVSGSMYSMYRDVFRADTPPPPA